MFKESQRYAFYENTMHFIKIEDDATIWFIIMMNRDTDRFVSWRCNECDYHVNRVKRNVHQDENMLIPVKML